MNSEEGKIWYGIGLDNSGLQRDADKSTSIIKGVSVKAKTECRGLSSDIRNLGVAVGLGFGVDQITNFGRTLIGVAGQFQTFRSVLENTLGSAAKADNALGMIQDFAATTPFQVDALTGSFVKLANQGFVPTVQQMTLLGDLASSTGKGFDQLTEAIIDAQVGEFERLKEFGIRASKQGDKVTFTFKEQATQVDFTASSIRDYILSLGELQGVQGANAKIASTLAGQYSNLQDTITQALNEMGQASSGFLSGAMSGATYLVQHYEEIGIALGSLIAVYGTYKAATLAVMAVQKAQGFAENIRLISMYRKELGLLNATQQAFNITAKANPYVLLGTVMLGVGAAVYAYASRANEAAKAQKVLNENVSEFNKDVLSEQSKLAQLKGELSALTKGTKEYNTVKDKIVADFGKYYAGLGDEIEQVGLTEEAYNKLSTAISKSYGVRQYEAFKNQQATELLETMNTYLGKIQDRLYEDLGDEKGAEVYTRIRNAILERKELDADIIATLDEVQDKGTIIADARVDGYIAKIREAQTVTDDFDKKAKVKFGISDTSNGNSGNSGNSGDSQVKTTYGEEYRLAQKDWQEAQKAFAAIEKDKDFYSVELYNEAKKRLDKTEKAFSALGGNTSAQKRNNTPLNPITEEDKVLIKDSIAWYDEQIRLLQEKRTTLTDSNEIAKVDTEINTYQGKIDNLNGIDTEKSALEATLAAINTYERERTRIVEEYSAKRKTLYEDEAQTRLKEGVNQSDVDWLNNAERTALTSLDLSTAESASKIKAIWNDATNTSSEAIERIISDAEELYNALSSSSAKYTSEIGEKFGITEEQFNALIEKIPELRERIDELREQSDTSQTWFEGMAGAWEQMIDGAKEGNLEDFTDGLDGICEKAGGAIEIANGLADALANLSTATGNKALGDIAEGIGQICTVLSDTLNMAQQGAQFGVVGAIVGGAIGLVSSIAKMFAAAAETQRETARLNAKLAQKEYLAQYEINQLYRERYEWAKKIGETELENAQRIIDEAEKQLAENQKEQDKLLNSLRNEEYISGYHTEKTGLFGWGAGKTIEDHSSLSGKSYEEILALEAAGKLTPEAQAYLDQLKDLYNEEGELAQRLEDARVAQQEAWSGTSLDEVVNTAMDSLLDGSITAAEAYDKIMQGAAKNMLRELMNDDLKEWYEGFAAAGEGGYTDEERQYWKKLWDKIQAENEQRKEDVENVTGVNFESNYSQSNVGKITGAGLTEETAGEFIGIQRGSYDKLTSIDNSIGLGIPILTSMCASTLNIERNTFRSAQNSEVIISGLTKGVQTLEAGVNTLGRKLDAIKTNTAKDNGVY